MTNEYSLDSTTLKQRIIAMPEDRILFRSDYPEYHTEFVGSILSELTAEGILVKIAQGIYAKPRKSRFGVVLPSVDKIVQAIATRDNAEVLPSGMTALNVLGLSTQVPMNYTYLTTGSERTIKFLLFHSSYFVTCAGFKDIEERKCQTGGITDNTTVDIKRTRQGRLNGGC